MFPYHGDSFLFHSPKISTCRNVRLCKKTSNKWNIYFSLSDKHLLFPFFFFFYSVTVWFHCLISKPVADLRVARRERSLSQDHHALCSGGRTGSACVSVPALPSAGMNMPLHQISVIPRDVTSSRVSGGGKAKDKDKQVHAGRSRQTET